MAKEKHKKYKDRDLSWLSFNERVLQEAEDKRNPLMERLKFLAIFSSNLEEFYKVRVARQVGVSKKNKFGIKPSSLLRKIDLKVDQQQRRFGHVFEDHVIPELKENGYEFVFDPLNADYEKALVEYQKIASELTVTNITEEETIFLKNQVCYLLTVTEKEGEYNYHLVEIDLDVVKRFYLVESEGKTLVFFVDDIIRAGMYDYFNDENYIDSYCIKLSRDADLYLDDEPYKQSLKEKIKASLAKRETGVPSRLLLDEMIPFKFVNKLIQKTNSDKSAVVAGGRYHRFYDFFGFPDLPNSEFYFPKEEKVKASILENADSYLDVIAKDDVLLSFPYQDYDHVIKVLEEAAFNDEVEAIQITLYRVAKDSQICQWLEKAIQNGKKVTVLTELKARFDESSNLYWNDRLRKAGAIIIDEIEELKVHAKIFLITFSKASGKKPLAHVGTGNFNEKTANIYADFSLLTQNEKITQEVSDVFKFLTGETKELITDTLLTSPFCQRKQIESKIRREIEHAEAGKEAKLILKVNSLEDTQIIDLLYEASSAGVKIDLIVRGICCIKPGLKTLGENIRVVSLVGKHLEHTRCFYFWNNGEEEVYCSSADMMTRNLDKRVEVGFPILKETHKKFMVDYLHQQLNDTYKLRVLSTNIENSYSHSDSKDKVDAQLDIKKLIEAL